MSEPVVKITGGAVFMIAVTAFIGWYFYDNTVGPSARAADAERQERQERLATERDRALASGPKITRAVTEDGSMIKVSFPSPSRSGLRVEWTHCIVWRDEKMGTAALQCEDSYRSRALAVE